MKLHELGPNPGKTRPRKRVGRGIAAGQGKTAGRGTKGQGARSGGGKGPYFEGGQLPLVRRLPFKRGFTNINKIYYQPVNLGSLAEVPAGTKVDPEYMVSAGLLKKAWMPVVILGNGDLDRSLEISAHRISGVARERIEAAGGTVTLLTYTGKGKAS